MEAGPRRATYRLMTLAAVAMMSARIASTERVYEPSIHRADPRGDVAAIVLPLVASTSLDGAALFVVGNATWSVIDERAPPRDWPRSRPQPMPTFGSNDRSRWATIRALVEDGTFAIGRREPLAGGGYRDTGRTFAPGYDSVDRVLDPTSNTFYSSKPPLLTVLVAGEYWLFIRSGLDLDAHPWLIVRSIVWTTNVLPLWLFLVSFGRVVVRYGKTKWGRLFTFAAASFGTFLTTFAVTLNNHVPAAVCAWFAIRAVLEAGEDDLGFAWGRLFGCGIWAGLAASFELPAAALLGGLLVGLLFRSPLRTLTGFLPAAILPIALQFGLTNAAVGEPWPVYAKLGEGGGGWYDYPGSHWRREPGQIKRGIDWAKDYEPRSTYALHLLVGHHGWFSLTPIWVLSLAAMLVVTARGGWLWRPECIYQHILMLSLLVSVAVMVFYAAIVGVANYGGWTSGPRWFFWLTPLWLLALRPAADRLAPSQLGRGLGMVLLAVSVFSASYPAWNPWRHPWIFNLMDSMHMIPY